MFHNYYAFVYERADNHLLKHHFVT